MSSSSPVGVALGRRRLVLALPLMVCGLVVPPVQARPDVYQSTRVLMGTRVGLTLQGAGAANLFTAAEEAFREMMRLSDMMSRYRSDSVVSAINLMAGLGPVQVAPELMQVLLMARQVARFSGGSFDATVGSFRDWDFDPQHPAVAPARRVAAQLGLVGQEGGLVLDERKGTAYLARRGMHLDLGGIAKLPILQAGLQKLQDHGVVNAMINGGGDVLVMGRLNGGGWRVGLRDPRDPMKIMGVVSLTQGFVAASGDYERFFILDGRRYHHILDPRTGYPTQGPHGVALIGDRLASINGLGTAIMVAGSQVGCDWVSRTPGLDALIVNADNSLWLSPGMERRLCGARASCVA